MRAHVFSTAINRFSYMTAKAPSVPLSLRTAMAKEIDPAQVSSVLQVLPIIGVPPSDTWAEVQRITMPSGIIAVAFSVRLVLDDGLLVRHVSALAGDESVEDALARVAHSMKDSGLRSIDVLEGDVDTDEEFHTQETVRRLMAQTGAVIPPVVH
jgi:hypothetical protein